MMHVSIMIALLIRERVSLYDMFCVTVVQCVTDQLISKFAPQLWNITPDTGDHGDVFQASHGVEITCYPATHATQAWPHFVTVVTVVAMKPY